MDINDEYKNRKLAKQPQLQKIRMYLLKLMDWIAKGQKKNTPCKT